jgi:hypothetical protein
MAPVVAEVWRRLWSGRSGATPRWTGGCRAPGLPSKTAARGTNVKDSSSTGAPSNPGHESGSADQTSRRANGVRRPSYGPRPRPRAQSGAGRWARLHPPVRDSSAAGEHSGGQREAVGVANSSWCAGSHVAAGDEVMAWSAVCVARAVRAAYVGHRCAGKTGRRSSRRLTMALARRLAPSGTFHLRGVRQGSTALCLCSGQTASPVSTPIRTIIGNRTTRRERQRPTHTAPGPAASPRSLRPPAGSARGNWPVMGNA